MDQITGALVGLGPLGIMTAILLFYSSGLSLVVVKLFGVLRAVDAGRLTDRDKSVDALKEGATAMSDHTRALERNTDTIVDQAKASSDLARAVQSLESSVRELKDDIRELLRRRS
jgi:uncharacterized protein YoxC